MSVDRSDWPFMVRIGLWGLPSRSSAWFFVWLSLAMAAASVAYGFVNPIGFTGVILVFAALWYYLAIRWVDRHNRWS